MAEQHLVAIASALIIGAVLGLLGAGGSIMTVPLLVYAVGVPPKAATSMSLMVVGAASLVAAALHGRERNVRLDVAMPFALSGAPGAFLGGRLAHDIPDAWLLLGFAFFMIAGALALLLRREEPPAGPSGLMAGGHWVAAALLGALIGTLTGVLGAGGGFLIVPSLALMVPLPMREAIGTSLVVISVNAAVGIAARAGAAPIDAPLTGLFVGAAITGAIVGHRLSRRVPARMLRKLFAVVVMLTASYMVAKSVGSL